MTDIVRDTIQTITKRLPAIVPYLHGKAGRLYCEVKAVERDPKEPMRDEKSKTENKIRLAILRRFKRQFAAILEGVQANYKDIIAAGVYVQNEPEEINELVILLRNAILAGIYDLEGELGYTLGETVVNERALQFAREYVTDWVAKLDQTTVDALRQALSLMPSGQASYADVVAILEPVFGNNRALRIAVTETTRIYAEATQIYANELVKEYPGFKVIKRWYTNVDDRVCPICAPLDGMEVAHDEDFNDVENPPAHVNCRCWITTTVKS